ncbi:S8 family serine peptidase, partial [Candidatus Parcubacteria bacterium]|nr:S8 family serine peptidase [Candidatus Parcubacteria bacterium]
IGKPDLSAPGVLICAARWGTAFAGSPTCLDSNHIRISGTSMATPHVAGAAALVRQAYPGYSPSDVKNLLKSTSRSLGLSADAQGSGEIDLKAAIPVSTQLNLSPSAWNITSNPTIKLSSSSRQFTISGKDPAITALDVVANFNIGGVTVSLSKNSLNIDNQQDSFMVSLVVDNDAVAAGNYSGSLVLSQGGATKGIIPIFLTVKPTATISATNLDYGFDNPSSPNWSSTRSLTITNLRTDSPQTLSLIKPIFPSGVTFQAPATITVPAQGQSVLDATINVDNGVLANGNYSGVLSLANASINLSSSLKFTKFYVLTISSPDNSGSLWVHNRSNEQYFINFTTNKVLYLSNPGPYDVVTTYSADSSGRYATVIKEGVDLSSGQATVNSNRSDANHLVKMQPSDENGNPVSSSNTNNFWSATTYAPSKLGIATINTVPNLEGFFSDMSSNYNHQDVFMPEVQPKSKLYHFYGVFNGLNNDLTYTNTAQDLKKISLQINSNITGAALPTIYNCFASPATASCNARYDSSATISIPTTQTLYTNAPAGVYFQSIPNTAGLGCPSTIQTCDYVFYSPYFDSTGQRAMALTGSLLEPMQEKTVYTGLGPNVWFGKFGNTSNQINLKPYVAGFNNVFVRQDYSLLQYGPSTYTISQNGVAVKTGTLPAYRPWAWGMTGTPIPAISLSSPGVTEFSTTVPYKNNGQSLNAKVVAQFNTSTSDPNPPSIKRMYYFTNNVRSEQHDGSGSNKIEFMLDPVGGNLGEVILESSNDGVNFSPVAVQESSGVYQAATPSAMGNKITLRLSASDSSANKLIYTFELPVINPASDSQAPTAAISSPVNNQTVSGTISVNVNASDNIGVVKVDLLQDGSLLTSKSAAPYTFSWNTSSLTSGSHVLSAKAYDAAGNVGTSTSVTVNIDNTAPQVSLTAPNNGDTVSGQVIISAQASLSFFF